MLDPVFGGTVVYLCEHNANGALGVVINKPTDMTMQVLFDRIDLKLEISPAWSSMIRLPSGRSCLAGPSRLSAVSCCMRQSRITLRRSK
ncbi:YqgE/AlgH family protein [Collimonas arenae]|uniref:YqgE/AlgH family protein n=1 Tax=Collimonas arenae TaxID=279058 RepID=UPI003AAF94BB